MSTILSVLALLGTANAAAIATIVTTITTTTPPDYFQSTPEIFQGPTPTGPMPFLAETNPAPFPDVSYIPPSPLETQVPIEGAKPGDNIYTLLGNIGPYHYSPGFGIDEHPLPEGAEIVWMNMLSRHGSRYPTAEIPLSEAIANASGIHFSGELSFLNTWQYLMGEQVLSHNGRQELFDSGVLHAYEYGHLWNNDSTTKLLLRTTTEDRMRKSAENFAAGFWGLNYGDYAEIEYIIDETKFNNSLAGTNACPNNNDYHTSAGTNASDEWIAIYTKPIAARLNGMSSKTFWNSTLVYYAQQLCAYETVNLGYSKFCGLFTYQEWENFEYSIDLDFIATYGFLSPTSRAVGIGYVEEVLARINNHLLTSPVGTINVTLDDTQTVFPTDQKLYFDFSHEVDIFSTLTAWGLKQFAAPFPPTKYTADRSVVVSHMVPFGCRYDIEIINTPHPICADAPVSYESGGNTTYIHFVLNQRTVPLGKSFPECGQMANGWCELETFLKIQANAVKEANFEEACYGDYAPPAYGAIDNGAPPS